ncbi:MAG TPA: MYXO-CTERM sorting domain-containing protein, partial [Kofleriaceae bacterium]|nr:MYXO-CTERM sorting domain-containing protein [Kofleriaceae bacterium]
LLADNVQMVFDGVRVTRVDPGTGSGDDQLDPPGDESSGCNARGGSGTGAGLLLALGLVLRRRRR